MPRTRGRFLFVGALVIVAAVVGGRLYLGSRQPPPERNVLLITLDTLRADHLGCYGYGEPTSPNLDRLAAESATFDLAIAQAAVTPVSHASILTGLEPYHHGLRVMHGLVANRLEDVHKTLAEVWKQAGGQTAAFVSAFPVTESFGLHQGFDHFDARFQQADGEDLIGKDGIVNTGVSQRRADETTTAATEWLSKQADPDRPLLMWVHYFDPHDPLVLPPKDVLERFSPASREGAASLRAIYDGEIFFVDLQIGRLLEAFKARGLWEQTAVVVVADHGEGLGDHDWWSHGILYQEQIRVPQIIRVPGMQRGRRVKALVRTIDLMPTILELAGIDPALWPSMDGQSLKTAMETGSTREPLTAYADSVNILRYGRPDRAGGVDRKLDKLYCLIEGRYKLIYHQLKPRETEFYDLSADPMELHDLASSRPAEMRALVRRLKELGALSDLMPGSTPADRDRAEKLKSLGYVE